MTASLFYFYIFFTGTLGILMTIEQLLSSKRSTVNYINAGFIFSLSVVQLYHGFMVTGMLMEYPHLVSVHAPFVYLVGPMLYFYLKFITDNSFRFKLRNIYHFIPALAIVILLLPFYLSSSELKYRYISFPLGRATETGILNPYAVLLFIMLSITLVYLIVFYVKNPFLRNRLYRERNRGAFYVCHITIIGLSFTIVIYLTGYILYAQNFFGKETYLRVIKFTNILVGMTILFIHILGERYADSFQKLRDEAESIRYQKSRIEGMDIDALLERLEALMKDEKIFLVEDLSLSALASELSIAPYQLSQILNERLKKNFNHYINEWRINEARELLISESDKPVSDIGFSVGFNSTSVFYSWFVKYNGVSPARYRSNLLKKMNDHRKA